MTETVSLDDGKGGATAPAQDPGAVSGWGVFRDEPWDFVGIYPSRSDAEEELNRAGRDYSVAFGTAHIGSNRFEPSPAQPTSA